MIEPDGRDVVELLLPSEDDTLREHARRTVTLARLVVGSLDSPRAGSTEADLECARSEFEQAEERERTSAIEALLREMLTRRLDADSFVVLPEPRDGERSLDWQGAWSSLERLRASDPGVPPVPLPGGEARELIERLIEWGRGAQGESPEDSRGGTHLDRWRVWEALSAAVDGDGETAERAWRELLGADAVEWQVRLQAVEGMARSLLDRGAVRGARDVLEAHLGEVGCSAQATHLLGWCCALLGERDAALEWTRNLAPARDLPQPLAVMRTARPEMGRLFRAARVPRSGPTGERPIENRRDVGAAFFAAIFLAPDGTAQALHIDASPALRSTAASSWRRRAHALRMRGEPEHRLVTSAEPILAWRSDGERLRGTLFERTRALALVPILAVRDHPGAGSRPGPVADGEQVVGWLHLECEHDLLPTPERLRAAARAWRDRVMTARADAVRASTPRRGAKGTLPAVEESPAARPAEMDADRMEDPRGALVREWFEQSGRKLNSRRWWVYDVTGETPNLVGTGGHALGDWCEKPGQAQALERARVAAGTVVFSEPNAALAIHSGAGSGRVVSLGPRLGTEFEGVPNRGQAWGLVAVESVRRGDVSGPDGQEFEAGLASLSVRFREAQFRAWCLRELGHDVLLRLESVGSASVEELFGLARSPSPLVLTGPAGGGKELLARWFHFESERVRWHKHACGSMEPGEEERCLFGPESLASQAPGCTLVLDGFERWNRRLQACLARQLERAELQRAGSAAGVRWLLISRHWPSECAERGWLAPELASRLERAHLEVRGLRCRRDWIAGLFDVLLRRFAAEEQEAMPELTDGAYALLWRQAWDGNVRQLETLAFRLILSVAARGRGPRTEDAPCVDEKALSELLGRLGFPALTRLSSRNPSAEDVRSALECTRRRTGALNKRRAAQYLGWDPDTLVARMADLKLEGLYSAQ